MTRTKVFLPVVPKKQDDVLKWAEQITHVLDELNLRAEKAAKESVSTRTGYIDLPLSQMFKATPGTSSTLALMTIVAGGVLGFYQGAGGQGWSTLVWLATTQATAGNTVASRWHTNFRLPLDYVSKTDLTLYLSGVCVEAGNPNNATTHNIDLNVYRNLDITSTNTEGFGLSPALDGSDWTWNTDLYAGAAKAVPFKNVGTSQFTQLNFIIDGDDTNYPLAANNLIQVQFTSTIAAVGVTALQYFANFYVTYVAKG